MSAAQLLLGFPETPPLRDYLHPGFDPRCPCDICTDGRAGGRKAGGARHRDRLRHKAARRQARGWSQGDGRVAP